MCFQWCSSHLYYFAMMFKFIPNMNLCQMFFLCCSFDSHVFVFYKSKFLYWSVPLWPKNSVQHFLWMNGSKNLNSTTMWYMIPKLLCFKDAANLITCFCVFGFVYCFASYCGVVLSELVSVLERDPYCSIDSHSHRLYEKTIPNCKFIRSRFQIGIFEK